MKDDYLGVDQRLNEMDVDGRGLVTRGTHHLFVTSPGRIAKLHRMEGQVRMMEPVVRYCTLEYTCLFFTVV